MDILFSSKANELPISKLTKKSFIQTSYNLTAKLTVS